MFKVKQVVNLFKEVKKMKQGYYIVGKELDSADDILVDIGPDGKVEFITFIQEYGADKEIREMLVKGEAILKAYEDGDLMKLSDADVKRLKSLVDEYIEEEYGLGKLPNSYIIGYRVNV
jgi:hypothetical protein